MEVHVAKNSSRFITFMNPYYRSLVKFRKDGNDGSIVSSFVEFLYFLLFISFIDIIDKIYLLYDK